MIYRINHCYNCKSILNCKIYIRAIEKLQYLLDIFNIKEIESIAKNCKYQKPIKKSEQLNFLELRNFFSFI